MLNAAQSEVDEGVIRGESRHDLRDRLERAMLVALKTELRRIEVGLPFLATVGSAAPFIGLFGTVWGIINSFTAIAQQKDTSLAVVAPGIAEALIATALGLAAAIPAVMAYNQISGLARPRLCRAAIPRSSSSPSAWRARKPSRVLRTATAPEPLRAGARH